MILLDPVRSITDFTFYRQVRRASLPRVMAYLAYVALLFAAAATVAVWLRAGPMIRKAADWASASLPTLTLAKGKLSSAASGPVRVQFPDVPEAALVVDTTRTSAVTAQEMEEQRVVVYLTESSAYVAPRPGKVEHYDLSKAANPQPVTLDGRFYQSVADILPKVLYPFCFLATFGGFLIWKLAAALVYSLLALALNAGMSGELEYQPLFVFSIYAQTPVILLQAVQLFLPKPIPYFSALSLIVVGAYLWQAIKQNAPHHSDAEPVEA